MVDTLIFFIPVIFLTMICEYPFAKSKVRGHYDLKDTMANIGAAVGMLVLKLLFAAAIYYPYTFFYQFRLFDLEKTWWVYGLLIFAEDYVYYWFHRISHESRFFWCSHETHHSSERLNISTAVRQTWTGFITGWIFWMPLVVLGFPPEWVVLQQSLNLFYQIFIHTEAVRKLGFIEKFMNTPSHHRVHHAINEPYLDKNYAGIFIIWDKLHNTFIEETDSPHYGTLQPIKSYNPFNFCFHMWIKLINDVREAPGLFNKLKTIFFPPGWRFDGTGRTTRQMQEKYRLT